MNCEDTEKFIHVYLDGEFAEEDRVDFERHLTSCEKCRRVAGFERRFKETLRSTLRSSSAPPGLRERVMTNIANAPPAPARAGAGTWALRIGGGAAAAVVLVAIMLQKDDPTSQATILSVLFQEKNLPLEVKGSDPKKVGDWYRDKLTIPVKPPRFADQSIALQGGRISRWNQRTDAAQLIYRRGHRKISVMIFPSHAARFSGVKRRIGDKNVYYSHGRGKNIAAFRHRGVGYTITADLPERELDQLVRSVVYSPDAR